MPPTHTISIEWENKGFKVQGWLSFPANYDPKKTYPLLVEPHGGPEWSIGSRWDGDAWRGINSFWPGMGYFLFLPNPRGSYGQGEAFTAANRRDLGYGDLRDVLKGMDTIEAKYPIDKNREGLELWGLHDYVRRDPYAAPPCRGRRRGHRKLHEFLWRNLLYDFYPVPVWRHAV